MSKNLTLIHILIHAGKGIDKKATITCIYVDEEFAQKMCKKDSVVYKGLINNGDWTDMDLK